MKDLYNQYFKLGISSLVPILVVIIFCLFWLSVNSDELIEILTFNFTIRGVDTVCYVCFVISVGLIALFGLFSLIGFLVNKNIESITILKMAIFSRIIAWLGFVLAICSLCTVIFFNEIIPQL